MKYKLTLAICFSILLTQLLSGCGYDAAINEPINDVIAESTNLQTQATELLKSEDVATSLVAESKDLSEHAEIQNTSESTTEMTLAPAVAAIEPTAEPSSAIVSEPSAESVPEPSIEASVEPTPQTIPEPVPEPTPEQTIEPHPEPVAEVAPAVLVWKSETGKKYHSINNCGRMNPNKATQITEAEALAIGLEKCSKCW